MDLLEQNLVQLDLEAIKPKLKEWAKQHPDIHALIAFGSRAKGTNRPDSDLDVCVLVDPYNGEKWYSRWLFQADQWKQDVLQILSIPPSKLQFCTITSDQVKKGLEDGCRFLYIRE